MLRVLFPRLVFSSFFFAHNYEPYGGWRSFPPLSSKESCAKITRTTTQFRWTYAYAPTGHALAEPSAYLFGFNKALWPLKEETVLMSTQWAQTLQSALACPKHAQLALDRGGLGRKTAAAVGFWARLAQAAPLLSTISIRNRTWPSEPVFSFTNTSEENLLLADKVEPESLMHNLDAQLMLFGADANPLPPMEPSGAEAQDQGNKKTILTCNPAHQALAANFLAMAFVRTALLAVV